LNAEHSKPPGAGGNCKCTQTESPAPQEGIRKLILRYAKNWGYFAVFFHGSLRDVLLPIQAIPHKPSGRIMSLVVTHVIRLRDSDTDSWWKESES
jgi:hypothetical protein